MGLIENLLTDGNVDESKLMARFGSKLVGKQIKLSDEENALLKTYITGYYAVQKSGEFVDYKREPYWKILGHIPPVPQVVRAAEMATRIGEELIDESIDLEYILRKGEKIPNRGIRALSNLLSGIMTSVGSEKIGDKKYQEVKSKLSGVVRNWSQRPENQTS